MHERPTPFRSHKLQGAQATYYTRCHTHLGRLPRGRESELEGVLRVHILLLLPSCSWHGLQKLWQTHSSAQHGPKLTPRYVARR
jgi:hypothetical protein